MEIKEAIEWLHGCIVSEEYENGRPNGNVTCDLTRDVLGMAISALEKQEGKKPSDDKYGRMCECRRYVDKFYHRFCPNCGQKIDWSDKTGGEK